MTLHHLDPQHYAKEWRKVLKSSPKRCCFTYVRGPGSQTFSRPCDQCEARFSGLKVGLWTARDRDALVPHGVFPKFGAPFSGIPITRITVFWGLFWGPLFMESLIWTMVDIKKLWPLLVGELLSPYSSFLLPCSCAQKSLPPCE